ncbi:MAG: aromatic ring-hydroxylating dioxygenase subunit alpha [Taibaiella sp.]|nr:aromatic ring-hydroxylating dioxygenase subunit alpha [Taibaiella sp.]
MPPFFVHPDIAQAQTLATSFYTEQQYFQSARELIFAPSWQYIGDADSLAGNGSALPITLLEHYLDEPLLLVRDDRGALRCMSNVCTHRGNILLNEPCKLRNIRCRYHGRQFALDGSFVSMPEFKEVQNFPTVADSLHQLPIFRLGNLLFTSLHNTIPPEAFFGDIVARLHWYPFDKLEFRRDLSRDYHVAANWALYCENYLEGFHIPFVHEGLNQALDFGEYTTELFRYANLQLGIAKNGDVCFDLPPSSVDFGKQVAAYYFWVFPNMMFNFYPWGLSVNIVRPEGVSACKVSFLTYVLHEDKMDKGAGTGLDSVEMEDEEIVQQVQRGIRSRFYNHGRYSVTREQGTHHFHQLIATFMNKQV